MLITCGTVCCGFGSIFNGLRFAFYQEQKWIRIYTQIEHKHFFHYIFQCCGSGSVSFGRIRIVSRVNGSGQQKWTADHDKKEKQVSSYQFSSCRESDPDPKAGSLNNYGSESKGYGSTISIFDF